MRTPTERREVSKWLARGASDHAMGQGSQSPGRPWRPPDPAAYAYLLGLYLGDGCLNPKGSELMISLDARYPGIVTAAEEAIRRTVPGVTLRRYLPKENSIRVLAATITWREAFPQHGRGRKQKRRIELSDWQRDITTALPRELLRGLIHSLLQPERGHPADLL